MQENYLAQLQDLIKVQKMWFYFVCWGIFCKGYKEQFYNVEICNAADAYMGGVPCFVIHAELTPRSLIHGEVSLYLQYVERLTCPWSECS